MGRTRIPDAPALRTWDDVNQVLMEIAEAEIRLAQIEGTMNVRINEAKEEAERCAAPIKAKVEQLGKQIKEFAELNRPDFGKAKSKVLTFGEVGFRASTSVVIKKALEEHIVGNLRKLGMGDCVRVVESVNKDVLATYPVDKIVQAGASLKKSDTFWYQTNRQELQ